jgi:hypothetical protein
MAVPSTLVLLRFREQDAEVLPSDEIGSLADLDVDAGLTLPPVADSFTGKGRAFSNGFALDAKDVVPGSSLATRDVTIQAIMSWDLDAQVAYGDTGTIVARGKGNAADEYAAYALELRVVNAALRVGELRLWWQDNAGAVHVQTGGQFIAPASGAFMLVTAVRRWISSAQVELRYYVGDKLLGDFVSADADVGGGTTGTFCVGTRYSAGVAGKFLCGVIDELRVLNYEITAEEIAATWDRMSRLQPRGYRAIRDLVQPGAPISDDPSSRIQKLLRIAGHALGYAAAQVENFRQNQLADRAFGPVLEELEGITGEAPKPSDSVKARRKRVIAHFRQRAGSSVPGVQATEADILALAPSQVQVLAFDNTIRDDFSAGLRTALWTPDPAAQWTIAADALRVQAGAGAAIGYDGGITSRAWYTCLAAALGGRGNPSDKFWDGRDAHIIAKLVPTTVPDHGEVGVVLYDLANEHALLFGLRNNGGTYQLITESFVAHKSQGVVIQGVAALQTYWLHLGPGSSAAAPDGYAQWQAAWSTTSQTTGYTSSADIQHPKSFGWIGMYARSFGAALAGNLDASFDDVILRFPYGHRTLRFYVLRDPMLPGAPDLPAAENALQRLKQAHVEAHVITKTTLYADDDTTPADRTPTGGF